MGRPFSFWPFLARARNCTEILILIPSGVCSVTDGLQTWAFGLNHLWTPNWNARTTIGVRSPLGDGERCPFPGLLDTDDLVAIPQAAEPF